MTVNISKESVQLGSRNRIDEFTVFIQCDLEIGIDGITVFFNEFYKIINKLVELSVLVGRRFKRILEIDVVSKYVICERIAVTVVNISSYGHDIPGLFLLENEVFEIIGTFDYLKIKASVQKNTAKTGHDQENDRDPAREDTYYPFTKTVKHSAAILSPSLCGNF